MVIVGLEPETLNALVVPGNMVDTRLDYLVSKLNLNSVQFESMPGGIPELDAMMVHAALGMGRGELSKEAYLLSRAVYQADRAHELAMEILGAEHIVALFDKHGWSRTKAYASHFRDLVENHGYTPAQIGCVKLKVAQKMPELLAQLAISEIANNGNCMTCRGTGRTRNYKECRPCGGGGKRPMTERYKADFILIDDATGGAYKQWHRTWRARYQQIYSMFSDWELAFFKHIIKYVG